MGCWEGESLAWRSDLENKGWEGEMEWRKEEKRGSCICGLCMYVHWGFVYVGGSASTEVAMREREREREIDRERECGEREREISGGV